MALAARLACALSCALAGSAVLGAQAPKNEAAEPQAKAGAAEARKLQDLVAQQLKKRAAEAQAAAARAAKLQDLQLRRGGANLEAQRQQVIHQLRPSLRAEYHIIRTICEATLEQRRAIARAGERALRDAAARNPVLGVRVFNGRPNPDALHDPVTMIREGLARAVKKELPPEQVARFQDELKRRAETQKQLAVRMLVSTLDQDLRLSDAQRVAISKSLLEHWDDTWAGSLTSLMALQNLKNFFPPIPDDLIVPFLSVAQKDVWQSSQSGRRNVIFGVSANRLDPGIEDEELTEAREAEDRLQEKPE